MTVKVENLTKKFDDKVILNNISFTVNTGEILAIVFASLGALGIVFIFVYFFVLRERIFKKQIREIADFQP